MSSGGGLGVCLYLEGWTTKKAIFKICFGLTQVVYLGQGDSKKCQCRSRRLREGSQYMFVNDQVTALAAGHLWEMVWNGSWIIPQGTRKPGYLSTCLHYHHLSTAIWGHQLRIAPSSHQFSKESGKPLWVRRLGY